jgi:hypothetical protein
MADLFYFDNRRGFARPVMLRVGTVEDVSWVRFWVRGALKNSLAGNTEVAVSCMTELGRMAKAGKIQLLGAR